LRVEDQLIHVSALPRARQRPDVGGAGPRFAEDDGIAFGIGFFIGPSLTGYLSAKYSLTTPIYLAACMSALSILCTATLLKGGRQSHHAFDDREGAFQWKTYAKYFSRPGLRERLFQFLFFITSFSLFISGFALFAERRFTYQGHPFGPREIGYIFGYVGFLGIILQGGLIGRLVKRFGESTLVAAGFVALASAVRAPLLPCVNRDMAVRSP